MIDVKKNIPEELDRLITANEDENQIPDDAMYVFMYEHGTTEITRLAHDFEHNEMIKNGSNRDGVTMDYHSRRAAVLYNTGQELLKIDQNMPIYL